MESLENLKYLEVLEESLYAIAWNAQKIWLNNEGKYCNIINLITLIKSNAI